MKKMWHVRDITEQILKANGKLTLMLCCVFSFWSGRRTPAKKSQPSSMTEAMILDSEAAVIANFEFLTQAETEMSDDDDMSDEIGENEETDMKTTKRKAKATLNDGKYLPMAFASRAGTNNLHITAAYQSQIS